MPERFRVVSWNIRAGGGKRAAHISDALIQLQPDLIVLSEYRSGSPSQSIAAALEASGYTSQCDTLCQVKPNANALLVASRTGLKRIPLRKRPEEAGRWLMVRETGSGIAVGAMHIPNQHTGRKPSYHDAIVDLANRWRGGPALLVGDTNSGQIGLDEETPVFSKRTHDWFDRLNQAGWQDGYRLVHGQKRDYTWFSHRKNGFRLDQVFVNSLLAPALNDVQHIWPKHPEVPERRDGLSDHAALLVDFGI